MYEEEDEVISSSVKQDDDLPTQLLPSATITRKNSLPANALNQQRFTKCLSLEDHHQSLSSTSTSKRRRYNSTNETLEKTSISSRRQTNYGLVPHYDGGSTSMCTLSTLTSIEDMNTSLIEETILQQSFNREGTSWVGGMIIMANVCLGMALLNFPRAIFQAGGLIPFGILFTMFVFLVALSLGMTAYCCRYYACVNYHDMVITSCGHVLGYLCKICLLLETMGNCIVKLVVFADQLDRIMHIIYGPNSVNYWYYSRQFTMPLVTSCTILPFCFLKNFQLFQYTSILGIIAAVYIAFGVTIFRYFTGVEMPTSVIPVTGPYQTISILPLLVYAFHGHIEAPVVFSNLRKNRIFYFMRMVYGYLFVAAIMYAVAAVFGYWTFGRFADEDLLLSYPNGDWVVNLAMGLIIFKLFTSFPVVFYVLRSLVEEIWREETLSCLPKQLRENEVRRIVLTFVLFGLCVLVAILVPNLSNAIHLIGGISCNLAFTFPGLCFMNIHISKDQSVLKHRVRIVIGGLFVVLGVFLTGCNTTNAVFQYFDTVNKD